MVGRAKDSMAQGGGEDVWRNYCEEVIQPA